MRRHLLNDLLTSRSSKPENEKYLEIVTKTGNLVLIGTKELLLYISQVGRPVEKEKIWIEIKSVNFFCFETFRLKVTYHHIAAFDAENIAKLASKKNRRFNHQRS